MSKEKLKQGSKIVENSDGTMEVTIEFDVSKHGHKLGSPRNYDLNSYQKMVNSEFTQSHILNGYCVGYYSHTSRSKRTGYAGAERNDKGELVYPICKTLSMEFIEPSTIRHTQLIVSTDEGKNIQKLIKSGIGGFSSVHDLKNGKFFGFDYVVSPNFTQNRAVVHNDCEKGDCSLDSAVFLDEIHNFANGDDKLKKALIELEKISIKDNEIDFQVKTATHKEKEDIFQEKEKEYCSRIQKLEEQVAKLTKEQERTKKRYFALKDSVENNGLNFDSLSGTIQPSIGAYAQLIGKADFDSILSEQMEVIGKVKALRSKSAK